MLFAGRSLGLLSLLVAPLVVGCAVDETTSALPPPQDPPFVPPPASCEPVDLDAIRTFPACNIGGGIFGSWTVDDLGLPAYDYGLDENADPRAGFFNTEGLDRRDHWAAFGNARVNALAFNDGYIEVTTQDRGETYLNKFDAEQGGFAGGFSYLDDGAAIWSTAYKWRPAGARTSRRFGVGYAEASMEHRGIRLVRRTFAPSGDAPAVIDEVTIENRGAVPVTLKHYEVWDVARRPIEINWLVSGSAFAEAPANARALRDQENGLFDEAMDWDPAVNILGLRRSFAAGVTPPARGAPSPVDDYPGDPFLVALVGDVNDVYTEQAAFFGDGGVGAPAAVVGRAAGQGIAKGARGAARSGLGQPRMMGLRADLTLGPATMRTLRFAYGYAPMGEPFDVPPAWRDEARDLRVEQAEEIKKHLLYFGADRDPALHREMAWHAAQMEVSTGYREYWKVHVVPQGSAYLYLHGADGAARDLSLFAIPLVYTHPALAKEELAMNMMMTYAADKRIAYAFQGQGMLDDALGLHKGPSDVTIFLLWALSEYIGATGDTAFLDQPMPYYPLDALPSATVYDHLHDAVRYLFDTVGAGDHGLVRLGTGDWSDGITLEAPDHAVAVAKGESVPNTQMAAAILPRVADLVEPRDAALAAEIRTRAAAFKAAAASTWTGKFFGRAYFGDGKLAYADTINLEAQVWALIGGSFASPGDRAALIQAARAELDEPSPGGATLLPGGQVWPAVSGLLTWGYAVSDPDIAWRHLVRNTMFSHAAAFPAVWYGIWSGPDGLNGPLQDRPGESWFSQVTPMVDFPVMNNNQHGMPLLAALRVAGVEATAAGLRIAPRVPGGRFTLETELVDVAQRGALLRGAYRPLGGGKRSIEVDAPLGSAIKAARVNGVAVATAPGSTTVTLDIAVPSPGTASTFEVDLTQ